MKLIFIYGLPASGKLTVAQELAALTGYKIFHNHLAVDLLLSVFEFGDSSFVKLREEIWVLVFEEACRSEMPGLIFTFAPERTVRPQFVGEAIDAVTRGGGEVDFVQLVVRSMSLNAAWVTIPGRSFTSSHLCLFLSSYMQREFLIVRICRRLGSLSIQAFTPHCRQLRRSLRYLGSVR